MKANLQAAVERLTRYNAWRRGEGEWADKTYDDLGFTAKELGETINTVLSALNAADRATQDRDDAMRSQAEAKELASQWQIKFYAADEKAERYRLDSLRETAKLAAADKSARELDSAILDSVSVLIPPSVSFNRVMAAHAAERERQKL